jgi:hypothetical protein
MTTIVIRMSLNVSSTGNRTTLIITLSVDYIRRVAKSRRDFATAKNIAELYMS